MNNPIKASQYTSAGDDLDVTHEFGGPDLENPAAAAGPLGDFLIAWQDKPIAATCDVISASLFGYRSYAPLINH